MATFDGSTYAEAIIPELNRLAFVPGVEIFLFGVAEDPEAQLAGHPEARYVASAGGPGGGATVVETLPAHYAETKGQALDRRLAELKDYLSDVASRLPCRRPYRIETTVAHEAASAIVMKAMAERVDMIVMATHGRTGLAHVLCGNTAEEVIRSGVAPVLLVPFTRRG